MQNVVSITVHSHSGAFRLWLMFWKTNRERESTAEQNYYYRQTNQNAYGAQSISRRRVCIMSSFSFAVTVFERDCKLIAHALLFYWKRTLTILLDIIQEVASWRLMPICLFIRFNQLVDDNHLKWNKFMGIYIVDFVLHYLLISHRRRWRSLISNYLFELKSKFLTGFLCRYKLIQNPNS